MTVAQLIKDLQALPQAMEVYVSMDAEGNGYSPMTGVYTCPSIGEGRELQAIADEDVDEYIANDEIVKDVIIIYPC